MNHLYLASIAVCLLGRCTSLLLGLVSETVSGCCQFTGACVLSIPGILYTKENVQIIKSIHYRFHGILGVVMAWWGEVPSLPCQTTC